MIEWFFRIRCMLRHLYILYAPYACPINNRYNPEINLSFPCFRRTGYIFYRFANTITTVLFGVSPKIKVDLLIYQFAHQRP